MSTTFDVIPLTDERPTFGAVADLANLRFREFLSAFQIHAEFNICFEALERGVTYDQKTSRTPSSDESFGEKPEEEYLRVFLKEIDGSAFIYFDKLSDFEETPQDPWWRLNLHLEDGGNKLPNLEQKKAIGKEVDRLWYITRYGGSPKSIHLLYGVMAGAMAELTNGIVTSSQWDMSKLPTTCPDFYQWYIAQHMRLGSWEKECVEEIRKLTKTVG